jgi:hypothetical protein
MVIGVSVVITSTSRLYSFYVRTIGIMILTVSTVTIMFVPKLIIIWFDQNSLIIRTDNGELGQYPIGYNPNGTRIASNDPVTNKSRSNNNNVVMAPTSRVSENNRNEGELMLIKAHAQVLEQQVKNYTDRLAKYEPTLNSVGQTEYKPAGSETTRVYIPATNSTTNRAIDTPDGIVRDATFTSSSTSHPSSSIPLVFNVPHTPHS